MEDILHSLLLQDAAVFPLGQFFSLKYHQGGESRVEEWAARARARDRTQEEEKEKDGGEVNGKQGRKERLSFHLLFLLFPLFLLFVSSFCRFKE